MNVIKTERRASMHTNILSDQVKIYTKGVSLADFISDDAIKIWRRSCSTSLKSQLQEKPTELECLEEKRIL